MLVFPAPSSPGKKYDPDITSTPLDFNCSYSISVEIDKSGNQSHKNIAPSGV